MALLKDGTRVYGTFNANTAVLVGNSTVNAYVTTTTISVANATQNLALTPISVLTGNTSEFFLANTTVLRVVSASSSANLSAVTLSLGTSIVNTSVVAAGANVVANTSALFIGNTTVNSTHTQALVTVGNSTSTANLTAAGITVGNSVVNTTAVAIGANLVANTSTILVGNSSVNSVVTSSLVQVANSTAVANLTATGLALGANASLSTSQLSIGNSSVNTVVTSTAVTVNNPGTSVISVGNTTVNSTLSSTTLTVRDIVATGNLNVNGTITYINTTNLTIGDNIITLNADLGIVAPSENAGIEINRGSSANVFLRWNEASDIWQTTIDGTNFATIATNNDVTTAYSNAIAYSGNAALAYANAIAYSGNAALAYANAIAYSGNAALAYANAIAYSANASTITSGTLDTARLPATANVSTVINVGANVNLSTSTINVGNSSINSTVTATQLKLGGNISANGGVGTAGQVLTSGASGNVYWAAAAAGGASVTISDNAPASPSSGNLWWDSVNAVMRIYYNDGDSSQWVDATPQTSTLQAVTAGGNITTLPITLANTTISGTLNVTANVVLGTTTINANGGVGTAGQVLTSSATGNVYWSTASGGGASVTISDTAPATPSAGNLWWDSTVGVMRIYYSDGTSLQWVDTTPQGAGGAPSTYILDDLSFQFDGVTKSFSLTTDNGLTALIPDHPYRINIEIGNIPVRPSLYLYDYYNSPEFTVQTSGFTVSGSTITFATPPTARMNFYGVMKTGDAVTPAFSYKQSSAFSAINIMSGY